MAFAEYAHYDGIGLGTLVADKEIKPAELVEEAIARAEALNPKLNAIVFKAYDRARAAAREKVHHGPFAGVPFLLKDISALATGMPTRQASRFLPPIPSDHDSLTTTRFEASGLIPLGKTNVPEFGLVPTTESALYGPCRNPWNLERSPGGSSGGSAAAVAAGIVPLAHANDGGGSIRVPASACGLVGLKPSRGRISFAPDVAQTVDGLATDLVVSRTVRDTAAALDAIAGAIQGDPYWSPPAPRSYLAAAQGKPKPLRIAFSLKKLDGPPIHADCETAVKHAAKLCQSLGHRVEEADPSLDQSLLIPAFVVMWTANLAAGIDLGARLSGRTPSADMFEGLSWGIYEAGKAVSASGYLNAKALMNIASREAAKFHETYDVWIGSTLSRPPVPLGTFDMSETDANKLFPPLIDYLPYTPMQNATGQPAINLPLHWNAEGLPIGVQFVGRFGDEETLLKLATELENAAPWSQNYAKIRI